MPARLCVCARPRPIGVTRHRETSQTRPSVSLTLRIVRFGAGSEACQSSHRDRELYGHVQSHLSACVLTRNGVWSRRRPTTACILVRVRVRQKPALVGHLPKRRRRLLLDSQEAN